MKQVIIVGNGLGLTGCQLIQLHEANLILAKSGLDLIEAVKGLQKVSQMSIIESHDLESVFEKASKSLSHFRESIKEKKPKYIRQQHKLAQRHYRRK